MTNSLLTNASHDGKSALACLADPAQHEGRQFGRRIEFDRLWTVYHVFTGIPAIVGGHRLAGLSRAVATASMLELNLLGDGRASRDRSVRRFSRGAPPLAGEAGSGKRP